jgi:hypothetical protein
MAIPCHLSLCPVLMHAPFIHEDFVSSGVAVVFKDDILLFIFGRWRLGESEIEIGIRRTEINVRERCVK